MLIFDLLHRQRLSVLSFNHVLDPVMVELVSSPASLLSDLYFNELIYFRDVRSLPDLGKSVQWPQPPPVLAEFVDYLKSIHARWRAELVLQKVPIQDRPEVQLKCIAYDMLQDRCAEWGLSRKWHGNYLARPDDNSHCRAFVSSLNHLQKSHGFEKVLFSCHVMKVIVVVVVVVVVVVF
jgi:myosin-1